MQTKFILMDIEGTTTSIDFVHKTLFPYAAAHIGRFVRQHAQEDLVAQALESVKQTVLEEQGFLPDLDVCIDTLLAWIAEDRKHTALKAIQGYLWKDGYLSGQYKGHLYPDVIPVWKKWQEEGFDMGIYSSGSVAAQKLLFGYSEAGDVTNYLSAHFDTKVGHKREPASYEKIAAQLELDPALIYFLSDVGAELDAAKAVGYRTTQLVRPGTAPVENHPTVKTFYDIEVKPVSV